MATGKRRGDAQDSNMPFSAQPWAHVWSTGNAFRDHQPIANWSAPLVQPTVNRQASHARVGSVGPETRNEHQSSERERKGRRRRDAACPFNPNRKGKA